MVEIVVKVLFHARTPKRGDRSSEFTLWLQRFTWISEHHVGRLYYGLCPLKSWAARVLPQKLPETIGATLAPHPALSPAGGEEKGRGSTVRVLRLISWTLHWASCRDELARDAFCRKDVMDIDLTR
jgi:hypothetical protein